MFPEMVGKKVFTESEKYIGVISEIKPGEFGSFIAVIDTVFSEQPKLEISVTRLRKNVKGDETYYYIPENAIPIKIKMILESEEMEEIEFPAEEEAVPVAPEAPPIEKFVKTEEAPVEEEAVAEVKEEMEEEEEIKPEAVKEEIEEEEVEEEVPVEEEKPVKKGGLSAIIASIIEALKRIFGRK